MRILAVHPGSSLSTADMYNGIVPQLERHGARVIHYRLDARISHSSKYLKMVWEGEGRRYEKPNFSDILYLAGQGVVERALRHDVDWVLVFSAMYLHPDVIMLLRRAGKHVAVILSESPYEDEKQAPVAAMANVAFTNERTSLGYLGKFNRHVHYLRHAFDPDRHRPDLPVDPQVRSHDLVFVGTGFIERVRLLERVNWEALRPEGRELDFCLYGPWPLLGSRHRLRRFLFPDQGPGVHGGVANDEAAALYRQASVGLSLHRTSKGFGREVEHITHAESMGPRDYELAASGCFFLSDHRAELVETLPSVPVFSTAEELGDLLQRYLADKAARARLVRELVEQASGHTFAARAAQILEILGAWSATG